MSKTVFCAKCSDWSELGDNGETVVSGWKRIAGTWYCPACHAEVVRNSTKLITVKSAIDSASKKLEASWRKKR